ncbi:uncharacterized protein [Macrobrachium rosenbergii]|uniref:uncharacterized protein n=1 Tax=Macrobrachium rosenbergii TaxID=79674 RepID=UPI0034D3DDFB
MGHCCVREVIFSTLLCLTSAATRQAPRHVWVLTGGRADLPCPYAPKHAHDQPLLVLWYRLSDIVPIYSYDARAGEFTSGIRWASEKALGGRAFFQTGSDPPMLVLEPAHENDQGVYTCRVDFRVSPSTTVVVNLTVVIPAGQPTIQWKGHTMVDEVGPLREEDTAKLTCRSAGGRPPPDLSWWSGERQLPLISSKSYSDPTTDTYWSEAAVSIRIHRALQGTAFSCRALTPTDENAHQKVVCEPKVSYVTMNITLPPLDVSILGPAEVTVSAGTMVTLTCRAIGSHPPARLTWWRGHAPLKHHVTNAVSSDRNVSTAALTMKVNKNMNEAMLACIANNPSIPHKSIMRTVKLIVHYLPVLELTLGQPLEADNIKEGDDVYFECSIVSNPRYLRVDWYHDEVLVEANVTAGVVVSGLSLVMRKLQPFHSGSYTCGSANQEGYAKSNPVLLTVRHAPICMGDVTERVQGASRGALAVIKCRVLAEPSRNVSWTWLRMRTDGTEEHVPGNRIQNQGLNSSVLVTPLRQEDYGRFMCRATNAVGTQRKPCVINLVPAGPPDAPNNCTAEPIVPDFKGVTLREGMHETTSSADEEPRDAALAISCMAGFDGGLPQYFLLEAWQDEVLVANISSEVPIWFVSELKAGMGVTLKISAHNPRGRSAVIRTEVRTASADQRAHPEDTKIGMFGIPPLLGGMVGVGGVLLLLLITGAIVAKHARPRKTPTHIHTLVMTTADKSTGKKAGIFDPDVVTSLRRHTDSLDVLPRAASSTRSTASQTPGQRQAFIQTNAHGHTVTKAYVHKQGNRHPSLSRGFCIRRQDSPFSDSDSDDSDESDSDSTFTDLTAAGRAAACLSPSAVACRSNSFPRTNSKNIRHIAASYNSQIQCCQGPQVLSSSEGKLHQVSCMQGPPSSSSQLHHITTSAGELHQLISSSGELQHLITASGGLQHMTSRGEICHITSTTGTLQHLTSTSKGMKHLQNSSALQSHTPSSQEPQYQRSSSLDGLHTFVFSEELQRFLTSRELCQISYSEKCFPFVPSATIWGTINNSRDAMPLQASSSHHSVSQQTLSSTVSMQPLSSSMDIDKPSSFRELRQAMTSVNTNLYPSSDSQILPAYQGAQPVQNTQETASMGLQLCDSEVLHHTDMPVQENQLPEPLLCGELLPPPSFREPHQKSPTEELPGSKTSESLQPYTLFSSVPQFTPGPMTQSVSFSDFKKQAPVSIELQSFQTLKSTHPVLTTETKLDNAYVSSSASCGDLNLKSSSGGANDLTACNQPLMPTPSQKLQKLFDSSSEIRKSSPTSILRSPKSTIRKVQANQLHDNISVPRSLYGRVNKPSVRFCDTLITEKCPARNAGTLTSNELSDFCGKPKQVSFAETDTSDQVLIRKTTKTDGAKASANRCAQLFTTGECGYVNKVPAGEIPRTTKESEMLDTALRDLLSFDPSPVKFPIPKDSKSVEPVASSPTTPPRGVTQSGQQFSAEIYQAPSKPSLLNQSKESDEGFFNVVDKESS